MIQKYNLNDTIILLPGNVSFQDRNIYSYQWYNGRESIGTTYQVNYIFTRLGKHKLTLIIQNKTNGMISVTTNNINVVQPATEFAPKWVAPVKPDYALPDITGGVKGAFFYLKV